MINFKTIIGIEIHVELNTKTKMFSPAKNIFNATPNTNVHPIDLGYPGTLPRVNKQAVIKAIKLAKALKMDIDPIVKFDRKNYFYPDLPKGYQITQQLHPIGSNGYLMIKNGDSKFKVEFERMHMEEDTAKQIHSDLGTLMDYNRAGVPLIEIVTLPILKSAKETVLYVDAIKKIVEALNIGDAKMSEGSLRVDVNISLCPYGTKKFGTKVEIKNMNSLSNIRKAIEFETVRQKKLLMNNEKVTLQTRRFDEETKTTITMRDKTDHVDYKYFRETNIPIIKLEQEFIDNIKLNELPWEIEKRLLSYNIEAELVWQLLNDFELLRFFNEFKYNDKKTLVNIIFAEIVPIAKQLQININDLTLNKEEFEKALSKKEEGIVSGKQLKEIILILIKEGLSVKQIIEKHRYEQISDEKILVPILEKIINQNNKLLEELNTRTEKVYKVFLGMLMKETKGKANPVKSTELLKRILKDK